MKSWKVPVNGVMYKCSVVKNMSAGRGIVGECNYDDKTIKICSTQKGSGFLKTYLHELFHAHDFESGWYQAFKGGPEVAELSAEGRANFIAGLFNLKIKKF